MNDDYEYNYKPRKPEWKKTIIHCLLMMAVAILLVCLIASCSHDDDIPVRVDKVLLVYLAGDNNLSSESYEKLEAIAQGYEGAANKRIVIYHDTPNEAACLYEIDNKQNHIPIEHYGKENSADSKVFSRVIRQTKAMYPEATFNLLIFSHASGWMPSGSFSNPSLRSVIVDGNQQMELSDLASAIPDHAFGSIIFEACHMAGIEVAYQLKDKADYIAAASAEIISPGFTPLYEKHIGKLIDKNTPEAFMQEVFDLYNNQSGYMRSATLSLIATKELDALASFVRTNYQPEKEVSINNLQFFDRGTGRLFCDFVDYYSLFLETDVLKQELQRLSDACIRWKASTPNFMAGYNGFAIKQHSGLTAYPMQERYVRLNASYKESMWYQAISNKNN